MKYNYEYLISSVTVWLRTVMRISVPVRFIPDPGSGFSKKYNTNKKLKECKQ